ncbi:tripartite tricarboxylate transporter TctB family protein [Bradyrhizobium sp. LHD-71]|uniref:tripartite tricarboxylate transporter TctB family protein n=1 Tax=Bradyrhizobium sp. LHD-71 TaxID=3072141 RepID=UPI00280DFD97|nr:tripartite tricarboxylate transporter TctB family protein [Bradyrhizobium sp. LHD-71]MDQ8729105.1 tripartite tricarboxylate transporter TctB family protein [Bradyrhizobium sp. LHD-71]
MSRPDMFAGLLLAAIFGGLLWEASSFQYSSEFAPGPGFAPVWISAIGLILSLLIAGNAWRTASGQDHPIGDGTEPLDRAGLFRVGATLIGLVVMLIIAPRLGLMPSMLVFLLFLTLAVQRLPFLLGVGASVATVCFIDLVFVRLLGVPIPSGPLGF